MPDRTPEAEAAYQRGRQEERVNTRLILLEDHSKAVNGQIKRLADTQDVMNDRLDGVIQRLDDAALVNQTLAEAAQKSGARKLGRWQLSGLILGIPVGMITIVLYLIEAIKGFH